MSHTYRRPSEHTARRLLSVIGIEKKGPHHELKWTAP